MGVIALFGILLLVPRLKPEEPSRMVQQLRALVRPKLLLFLLIAALGNTSLFAVFTYIAPMLQDITGFGEHSVTWILVIFSCGVTLGNIAGGRLADWKLMPSLLGLYLMVALILGIFTFTVQSPTLAILTIFFWGFASFGVMPGLQVRIMSLAKAAPALASTASHSAGNLGNAAGAFIGGLVIIHLGLPALPWVGSLLAALALLLGALSYGQERKAKSA